MNTEQPLPGAEGAPGALIQPTGVASWRRHPVKNEWRRGSSRADLTLTPLLPCRTPQAVYQFTPVSQRLCLNRRPKGEPGV